MWYVYFLERSDTSIYVGFASDLKGRVKAHQNGEVISTKGLRPVSLKSDVAVETKQQAQELEAYFKSGSGKAFAKRGFCECMAYALTGFGWQATRKR